MGTRKSLRTRWLVTTGAASGIGKGIAERCVREGMNVVLADIDEEELYHVSKHAETVLGRILIINYWREDNTIKC